MRLALVVQIIASTFVAEVITIPQQMVSLDDYEIMEGQVSSCGFNTSELLEVKKQSTYECIYNDPELLSHSLRHRSDSTTFDHKRFLSAIRGKTFTIIGDSVGLQMYYGLTGELFCEQSSRVAGNGKTVFFLNEYTGYKIKPYGTHILAETRKYSRYNAAISWCVDQTLDGMTQQAHFQFCIASAMKSDILFIAIGAHFKPLFRKQNTSDYYESLSNMTKLMKTHSLAFRKLLLKVNPKCKVIWREFPHTGNHDELMFLAKSNGTLYNSKNHLKGELWSHVHSQSPWVTPYNR
jgi:hypothetical protein